MALNAETTERNKSRYRGLVPFPKGKSGNPGGRTKQFAQCQRLCREASPDAARRLIELMQSEDERVALMAADKVFERAWGRPKEYLITHYPQPSRHGTKQEHVAVPAGL